MDSYVAHELCHFAKPPWDCYFMADEVGNMPWHIHCQSQDGKGRHNCDMRFFDENQLYDHMLTAHGVSRNGSLEPGQLSSSVEEGGNRNWQQEAVDGSSEIGCQESEPSMMEVYDQQEEDNDGNSENGCQESEPTVSEIGQVRDQERDSENEESREYGDQPAKLPSPEQLQADFPCIQCTKSFHLQKWLTYHDYIDHGGLEEPFLTCRGCHKTFQKRSKLYDHKRKTNHQIDTILCPHPGCLVGDRGINLKNLRKHYLTKHRPKGYTC